MLKKLLNIFNKIFKRILINIFMKNNNNNNIFCNLPNDIKYLIYLKGIKNYNDNIDIKITIINHKNLMNQLKYYHKCKWSSTKDKLTTKYTILKLYGVLYSPKYSKVNDIWYSRMTIHDINILNNKYIKEGHVCYKNGNRYIKPSIDSKGIKSYITKINNKIKILD